MTGTVLITGAARRIGRHMALSLATKGWAVAVHYNTSMQEAEDVVAEIQANGGRGVAVQGDLSVSETPEKIVASAVAALGPLTCLVNNASKFDPDEAETVTHEGWDEHLNTNVRAPVFLAQTFAAQLPEGMQEQYRESTMADVLRVTLVVDTELSPDCTIRPGVPV